MTLLGAIVGGLSGGIAFSGTAGNISEHTAGGRTLAGVNVAEWDATKIIAAAGAVGFISDTAGALPLRLVERDDPNGRSVTPPEFSALWRPRINPHRDRIAGWTSLYMSLTITGNAFAQLVYAADGALAAIYPLNPATCRLAWAYDAPETLLLHAAVGPRRAVLRNAVGERPEFLHVVDRTRPGEMMGISRVAEHREQMGFDRALHSSLAASLGNGMQISGIVGVKGLNEERRTQLGAQMRERFSGPGRAGRVLLTETNEVSFERIQWSPADVEWLATTKQSFETILSIWQCPPLALGMTNEPSSWGTGLSEIRKSIDAFTVRPWAQKVAATINAHLLEATPYEAVWDFDALQAASPKERAEIEEIRLRSGQTSLERVLQRNDEPPFADDETVYSPLNMATTADREAQRLRMLAQAARWFSLAGIPEEEIKRSIGIAD